MRSIRTIIRDPFSGLSHLVGGLLSIAGLVVLLVLASGRPWHVVGFAVYGTSLILLYSASAIAHSVHCSAEVGTKLDRLDYAAIFLLIAGTYTPLCLVSLRGGWGWSLFGIEWAMAIVGVIMVLLGRGKSNLPRTLLYVAMGWVVLIAIPSLWSALPAGALWWLGAGGAVYSLGAIVFVSNRPVLWPGWFGAHDLWHCLVMAASACHFVVMARYVA